MALCSKAAARPENPVPAATQLLPWLRSSTCVSSDGASCVSDSSRSDGPHGSILWYHFSNISASVRSRALAWLRGGGGSG